MAGNLEFGVGEAWTTRQLSEIKKETRFPVAVGRRGSLMKIDGVVFVRSFACLSLPGPHRPATGNILTRSCQSSLATQTSCLHFRQIKATRICSRSDIRHLNNGLNMIDLVDNLSIGFLDSVY